MADSRSALAADLRGLAVLTEDTRRHLSRDHGRTDTRTARLALEIAEAALRIAGHQACPELVRLPLGHTLTDARARLLGLVARFVEIP